ncbi:calcium-binding protein [Sphingomonas sp.]|uniref:calcium-binding protein n=1 Tax=Sphingomonas sp. TaxID=28214 RepID=UPI0035C7ADA3
MARYRVKDDQIVKDQLALASGDSLYVAWGGEMFSASAGAAVTLSGAGAFVRNLGYIETVGEGFAITGTLSGTIDTLIRNEDSGTIIGGAGGIKLSSPSGSDGEVRLVNAGLIAGGNTWAIDFKDLRTGTIVIENLAGGEITNYGTADVIRPGNDGESFISITNAGTIRADVVEGESASGDAIDLQPEDGGNQAVIVNETTGIIKGGKHGITGANTAFIVNLGDGQIIGRNGSGINFDTEAADGDGAVTVLNRGTISGRYDGYGDGDGDGVDVDYLIDINNYGTIEGVGADNIDDFADGIAAGGGQIRNHAGATIHGAFNGILIDDGDRNGAYAETRLNNEGTISADQGTGVQFIGDFADRVVNGGTITGPVALDTGAGDDRVTNTGTLAGDVLLGSGNDFFRSGLGASAGIIDGGAGDDRISATDGAQTIIGGLGRDLLAGGAGADTFVYTSIAESNRTTGADRILDYLTGDVIDLTAIDANTNLDGDQAFTSIGTAAFSGVAGELRIAMNVNGNTLLGDVDGDRIADFAVSFGSTTVPSDILAGVLA